MIGPAGNPFTDIFGAYSTSEFVTARISFDLPTNVSLPAADYSAFVTVFSFSDGVRTITDADGPFNSFGFGFATDALGNITLWGITVTVGLNNGIQTVSALRDFAALDGNNQAENSNSRGTWNQVSVSEPSTLALTALALGAFVFLGWRRRRTVPAPA